jgi:hypothetical protein
MSFLSEPVRMYSPECQALTSDMLHPTTMLLGNRRGSVTGEGVCGQVQKRRLSQSVDFNVFFLIKFLIVVQIEAASKI